MDRGSSTNCPRQKSGDRFSASVCRCKLFTVISACGDHTFYWIFTAIMDACVHPWERTADQTETHACQYIPLSMLIRMAPL